MVWHASPDELERLPRPVAALAGDYPHGHRIAPHRHRHTQFVHATEGVLRVSASDGVWVVPPGHAVWMPAGMVHGHHCFGRVAMRTLYLPPRLCPVTAARCVVVVVPPLLRELILQAVEMPALYDEDGADGRLVAVLLDQLAGLREAPFSLTLPVDVRARRVADALLADPADNRELADWAAQAGASSRTLARLFARETGSSFAVWRQHARLQAALPLLAAGHSVTATALELGYEQPSAFIAMFRRVLGVTPGQYQAGNWPRAVAPH